MIYGRYGVVPGKPDLVSGDATSGGAGNTDATIGPAAGSGEIWIVLFMTMWHDDDHAARNMQWRASEGGNSLGLHTTASDAALTYRSLYERMSGAPVPFTLDENSSLIARGVDVTAGHKVNWAGWVHKIKGMHTLE